VPVLASEPCDPSPVAVSLPAETSATSAAAGSDFSLALLSNGTVMSWGVNLHGELGNGTTTGPDSCLGGDPCNPNPASVALPSGTRATAVSAGDALSLALTSSGSVLSWGTNQDGDLGIGTLTGPGCGGQCATSPVAVKLPAGTTATAIAAFGQSALALTSTGSVLAWGFINHSATPTTLPALSGYTITAIAGAPGPEGGLFLTSTGSVLEVFPGSTTPSTVAMPSGTVVTAISGGGSETDASGEAHYAALTSTGSVLSWGANDQCETGNGSCSSTPTYPPVATSLPAGVTVTAISAGDAYTLALTSTGAVWGWGFNRSGNLGIGSKDGPDCGGFCHTTPVGVALPARTKATAIFADTFSGLLHSLVVTAPAPSPTQLSTSLTSGSQSGSSITVPTGTPVTDSASLSGTNSSTAGGTVDYTVYSDKALHDGLGKRGIGHGCLWLGPQLQPRHPHQRRDVLLAGVVLG
jgi:Regulator of chromosome condensation (RCC1) repeat